MNCVWSVLSPGQQEDEREIRQRIDTEREGDKTEKKSEKERDWGRRQKGREKLYEKIERGR